LKLVAGLGNPGPKYAGTRHNIGFMAAELLAGRSGIALKKQGHQGVYGFGRACGEETTILLPQTYMNRSGSSVGSMCKSLGISPGDLVVLHDDIDLPFGTLRIKVGGGHGGHNGIRSIREVLGTGEFVRVKLGVGRPAGGGDVAGFVLNPFSAAERKVLEKVLELAVEAVEAIVALGPQKAMNEFNNRAIDI